MFNKKKVTEIMPFYNLIIEQKYLGNKISCTLKSQIIQNNSRSVIYINHSHSRCNKFPSRPFSCKCFILLFFALFLMQQYVATISFCRLTKMNTKSCCFMFSDQRIWPCCVCLTETSLLSLFPFCHNMKQNVGVLRKWTEKKLLWLTRWHKSSTITKKK